MSVEDAMKKRNLFIELMDGINNLRDERLGKITIKKTVILEAEEIIAQERIISLSNRDVAILLEQLDSPAPAPSKRLSAAYQRYKKKVANGSLRTTAIVSAPLPEEIKGARLAAELSQTEAASLIHSTMRTWQDWEAGKAAMHPGLWELFLFKTGA